MFSISVTINYKNTLAAQFWSLFLNKVEGLHLGIFATNCSKNSHRSFSVKGIMQVVLGT